MFSLLCVCLLIEESLSHFLYMYVCVCFVFALNRTQLLFLILYSVVVAIVIVVVVASFQSGRSDVLRFFIGFILRLAICLCVCFAMG